MNVRLKQIDENDFWALFHELFDDESDFIHNRAAILRAYKDENLYGLEVQEDDNYSVWDPLFCRGNSQRLIPCFCVKQGPVAIIMWTHTRARLRGFARKLVELLGITEAYDPLPGSENFWERCKVKIMHRHGHNSRPEAP